MRKLTKDIIIFVLRVIPYPMLVKIYDPLSKTIFRDYLDYVYVERFYKESKIVYDLDSVISKAKKKNRFYIINYGLWDYKFFNFCFLKNMISLIIYSLERGFIPLICIKNNENGKNIWEEFLEQPVYVDIDFEENIKKKCCKRKYFVVYPSFLDVYDRVMKEFWSKVFNRFIIVNPRTEFYFNDEIYKIIKDKKVVACVVRGTDYLTLKPKGHPIQPELGELLDKVQEIMEKTNSDYVYLATEEKRYADVFKLRFPGKILENMRKYFDDSFYKLSSNSSISEVSFDRENDEYLKSLEYFSSINIVSKCNSLVAGLCGGSQIAIYLNNNKYEVMYLFDKGYY